jgi:hypothetical protein
LQFLSVDVFLQFIVAQEIFEFRVSSLFDKLKLVGGEGIEVDAFDVDLFRGCLVDACAGQTEEDGKVGLYPLLGLPAALEADCIERVLKQFREGALDLLLAHVAGLVLHIIINQIKASEPYELSQRCSGTLLRIPRLGFAKTINKANKTYCPGSGPICHR